MQNAVDNKNIGENIRFYRIKAKLSIKKLSAKILKQQGVLIKDASIRNYEKGVQVISATNLNIIALVLNTDISNFYKTPTPSVLLDNNNNVNMLEAYSMIEKNSARDALLHLARVLAVTNA